MWQIVVQGRSVKGAPLQALLAAERVPFAVTTAHSAVRSCTPSTTHSCAGASTASSGCPAGGAHSPQPTGPPPATSRHADHGP